MADTRIRLMRRGGGGPGRRARGGDGRGVGTREQCGQQHPSLKNPTIGLIWLVTRGAGGEA